MAAVDGEALIATFLDLVSVDRFTAETEITANVTGGSLQVAVRATGSLSGGDGTMTYQMNTVSASLAFEAIFLGDYGYVRLTGGEWTRVLRDEVDTAGTQLDSFEFLTSTDDLRYEGTTIHDGREVHVLANTRTFDLQASPETEPGQVTRLRILVLADGTPVFLSYHMTTLVADGRGGTVSASGDVEQAFRNVGEPVVIEPPASFTE